LLRGSCEGKCAAKIKPQVNPKSRLLQEGHKKRQPGKTARNSYGKNLYQIVDAGLHAKPVSIVISTMIGPVT
jgi:hypothetical protein